MDFSGELETWIRRFSADAVAQLLSLQTLLIVLGLVVGLGLLAVIAASLAGPAFEGGWPTALSDWIGEACPWACPWVPRRTSRRAAPQAHRSTQA